MRGARPWGAGVRGEPQHDAVPRVPGVGQGQAARLRVTRHGVMWTPRVGNGGKKKDRERRSSCMRKDQAFALAPVRGRERGRVRERRLLVYKEVPGLRPGPRERKR